MDEDKYKSYFGLDTGIQTMTIGKIPGYNIKINPPGPIKYENRLLNNLTTVRLRPTGYTVNIAGIGEELFNGSYEKIKKYFSSKDAKIPKLESALYKFGPSAEIGFQIEEAKDKDGKDSGYKTNSTTTAVDNWQKMIKNEFSKVGPNQDLDIEKVNQLELLITNDSTVSEVFSNDFSQSTFDKLADSAANSMLGKGANFVKGITKATTVDSATGLQLLEAGSGHLGAMSILKAKALGIQSELPREWIKSSYTQTLQVMIKLISPSGHPDDISEYIEKPLKMLILAASPVSYDGISFGYPMLWEVEGDGLMNMKLAALTSMTITRGGTETQFNRFNQPLNVDIRLTIEPLVNGFATLVDSQNKKYKDFLLSNPEQFSNSLAKSDKSYDSILL